MEVSAVHYIKFNKSQAMPMFRHCARKNEHYSNENIDPSRTHLNYNLAPGGNQWGRMQDRLKQLTYREQKNNIVLCGWVVTAPANLPEEKQRQFFKIMYEFMCKKYGENNVVSAYVHKDEAGPGHMHFLFVPATPDNKLSASKTTNRILMQNIHEEAQQEIDKYFNHQYLLRADNPEDRYKHKSPKVDVYKETLNSLELKNEIAKLDNEFYENRIQHQQRVMEKNNQIIAATEQENERLQKENNKYKELNKKMGKSLKQFELQINELKEMKPQVNGAAQLAINQVINKAEKAFKPIKKEYDAFNDEIGELQSRQPEISDFMLSQLTGIPDSQEIEEFEL